MANDIDMWEDIEELEKENKEQAEDLLKVYIARFIEGDIEKAEKLREKYEKKYKVKANYW